MNRCLDTHNQPIKDTSEYKSPPDTGNLISCCFYGILDFEKSKQIIFDGLRKDNFGILDSASSEKNFRALLSESHVLANYFKKHSSLCLEHYTYRSPTDAQGLYKYSKENIGSDVILYENKKMVVDPKFAIIRAVHFNKEDSPSRSGAQFNDAVYKISCVMHDVDKEILENNSKLEEMLLDIQGKYADVSDYFSHNFEPKGHTLMAPELSTHTYPEYGSIAVCISVIEKPHAEQLYFDVKRELYPNEISKISNYSRNIITIDVNSTSPYKKRNAEVSVFEKEAVSSIA